MACCVCGLFESMRVIGKAHTLLIPQASAQALILHCKHKCDINHIFLEWKASGYNSRDEAFRQIRGHPTQHFAVGAPCVRGDSLYGLRLRCRTQRQMLPEHGYERFSYDRSGSEDASADLGRILHASLQLPSNPRRVDIRCNTRSAERLDSGSIYFGFCIAARPCAFRMAKLSNTYPRCV